MSAAHPFHSALQSAIRHNIHNFHTDNYSIERFGKKPIHLTSSVYDALSPILYATGLLTFNNKKKCQIIDSFQYLYDRLADEHSRALLIQVLCYRLLGHRKVKLPIHDGSYVENVENIKKHACDTTKKLVASQCNKTLYYHDLHSFGFPCKLYYTSAGIYHRFLYKGYEYIPKNIGVKKGDTVIDAGACWGDSALYFSLLAGIQGRVYCFEFVPDNLTILHTNIELNPALKKRIEIITRPLWSSSEVPVSGIIGGPGSRIVPHQANKPSFMTITLDDIVKNKHIPRVDFIKMDIEGSELHALKGSEATLIRDKPNLAISVYHKPNDCHEIPAYIESLKLGYSLYFGHHSMHHEESVLFCTARK